MVKKKSARGTLAFLSEFFNFCKQPYDIKKSIASIFGSKKEYCMERCTV